MTDQLRVLDAADVESVLTPALAFESQRKAFEALASGEAVLPPRLLLPGAEESTGFCYLARLRPDGPAVSKLGSVNPVNTTRELPAVHAIVTVLDPSTGAPRIVMDGTSLTTLRTAAASALAVDVLAPQEVSTLAVFGTGVQTVAHLRAVAGIREWREVRVVGSRPGRAEAFVEEYAGELPLVVGSADDLGEVVLLCTTSATPLITDDVAPGTTVVSVGSFTPDRSEYPGSLLAKSRAVVDDVESCAADSGPVLTAVTEGVVSRDDLVALGDVLLGRAQGRTSREQVVVYTSVGIGVQDAAAAEAVLDAVG